MLSTISRKVYKGTVVIENQLSTRVMRTKAVKRIRRFPSSLQAEPRLWCGEIERWINIDLAPVGDMQWDLTKALPFANSSCSVIYSEHSIEHLTPPRGRALLAECHRVLIEGGALRIAMPSLEHIARKYLSPDWRDQEWLNQQYAYIKTPAEMFNVALRSWGHEWLYDEVELRRRLADAGFQQHRRARLGQSELPEFRGLETRPDSLLICEATR